MSKEDAIEVMAVVLEPLPNAMLRVDLEKQTPGAGARFGEDAEAFHSYSARGQGRGGAFTLRSESRTDCVSL